MCIIIISFYSGYDLFGASIVASPPKKTPKHILFVFQINSELIFKYTMHAACDHRLLGCGSRSSSKDGLVP